MIFQYKCDNFYHPEAEGAIAWNDPDLGIEWRIGEDEISLSKKDRNHLYLRELSLWI